MPSNQLVFNSRDARLESSQFESTAGQISLPVAINIPSVPHIHECAFTENHHRIGDDPWLFRVVVLDQELFHYIFGVEMILEVVDDDHIVASLVALSKDMTSRSQNPRPALDV